MPNSELDKFGEFFVKNLRDTSLNNVDFLLKGKWKAPALRDLQKRIASATDEERALIYEVVDRVITSAMHDLLFAFKESSDLGKGIQVIVDGKDVSTLSDGIHAEIFLENGWIKRFSEYPYKDLIQ